MAKERELLITIKASSALKLHLVRAACRKIPGITVKQVRAVVAPKPAEEHPLGPVGYGDDES